MKKITKWIVLMVCLGLILGGYQMLHSSKKELAVTNKSEVKQDKMTTKDKQLAYLREHEQEIIDFVKSQNDKIESVQIDWSSMEVEQSGNGTPQGGGYGLSLKGKFNNLSHSKFTVNFYLEHEDDMPNIKFMGMLNKAYIQKDGIWRIYD